jgi:hypothetical protein
MTASTYDHKRLPPPVVLSCIDHTCCDSIAPDSPASASPISGAPATSFFTADLHRGCGHAQSFTRCTA